MKHIDFPRDYQRLFRFENFSVFFIDNWMIPYTRFDAMVLTLDKETTFYLPKKFIDFNLQDGVDFLGDDKKFRPYIEDYEAYIPTIKQYFDANIKDKEEIGLDTLNGFLDIISDVFRYFYKTEFFFLDKAYEFRESNPTIKRNSDELYELKEVARVKTLNDVFWGENCFLSLTLKKLAKQFNISRNDIMSYTVAEVRDLYDGQEVKPKDLAKRDIARIIYSENGKINYIFGEEAAADVVEFKEKTGDIIPYDAVELKGIPTNKGKVTGKVKIITSNPKSIDYIQDEFAKMDKGDILTVETSSPEFMPACVKASAIIADQGGLLSHAAVVSRELGIPSIVALKHATKVLKDGDMVEVDGETGIVKKL